MKFVREASQRRSASHTHKHDPDTHGDQTRNLIIQPELTSTTVLGTSDEVTLTKKKNMHVTTYAPLVQWMEIA